MQANIWKYLQQTQAEERYDQLGIQLDATAGGQSCFLSAVTDRGGIL